MNRSLLLVAVVGFLFLLTPGNTYSQASKRLGDRAPKTDPQRDAWNQVDKINRETDGTRSRNAQARKAGKLDEKRYTGGSITKRHVLPSGKQKTAKQKSVPPR